MIALLTALALGTAATSPAAPRYLEAARNWVSLVDERRWNESWSEAGTFFKSRTSEPGWATIAGSVRSPLGAVEARAVRSSTRSSTLPGMPDGDYDVVQFQTRFEHKADAVETVVLAREGAHWKVDGYFIR